MHVPPFCSIANSGHCALAKYHMRGRKNRCAGNQRFLPGALKFSKQTFNGDSSASQT